MKIFLLEKHVPHEFDEVYGIFNSFFEAAEDVISLVKDFGDHSENFTISAWQLNTSTDRWETSECYDYLGGNEFSMYDENRHFLSTIRI